MALLVGVSAAVVMLYVLTLWVLNYLALWQWSPQNMGSVPQALATLLGAIVLILGWVVTDYQSTEREIATKRREQASVIAEYAALARTLNADDDVQVYRRANDLAWRLFLWLPDDVYRQLGKGLVDPVDNKQLAVSLLAVRKLLLGKDAGALSSNDMISHWPGIGRPKAGP